MLGNFNQTWVNILPTNIGNNWTPSLGSMGWSELFSLSWVGTCSQGSPSQHYLEKLTQGCWGGGWGGGHSGLQWALSALPSMFHLSVFTWELSNQADTSLRHSQPQEMALPNWRFLLLFFSLSVSLFNLVFNYLLPLYGSGSLQDSGGGLGEQFPLWLNIIIHNDCIWSFYKFLIILSDWCTVICIGCLAEQSFRSVTYI